MSSLKRQASFIERSSQSNVPSKSFRSVGTKRVKPSPGVSKAAVRKAIAAARETKHVFTELSEANLSTVSASIPYTYFFPVPGIGPSSNERIGNKINPTSLSLKVLLHNNSSQTVHARLLVMKLKHSLTVTEIQNEIFEGIAGQDVTVDGSLQDLIKRPNREAFVIMHDEIITLGYDAAGYSSPFSRAAVRSLRFKPNMTQIYHDEDLARPVTNDYVFCLLPKRSDADESLGETIEFSWNAEMWYKD